MTTFVWREVLSVSVGEMSRTQAIECCRKFDAITEIFTDYVEQTSEADILVVLEAPVVIKVKGEAFTVGERTIQLSDDESFVLSLPLTRDSFDALPMSLATAWINAALRSNEWFIDTLKKVYSLTTTNNFVSKSGSALSNAPTPATLQTTTIGQ